jgi:hypothetical protein
MFARWRRNMRLPAFIISLAILLPALMLAACAVRAPATRAGTPDEAYPHHYDGSGGGGGGGGGM